MELKGEQTIALPREQVWAALNDPKILQQCIPGCDAFELIDTNQYQIVMTAAVGPVKAKFKGKLQLADIRPPESYALSFDGSGGAAGFGKGNAAVSLTEEGAGNTRLQYTVAATVGGRLAQVGARLIDGVAKKMADEFFTRFKNVIDPGTEPAAVPGNDDIDPARQVSAGSKPRPGLAWIIAAVVVVLAGLFLYTGA